MTWILPNMREGIYVYKSPVCLHYTHTHTQTLFALFHRPWRYCNNISRGPGITSKSCLAKLTLELPLQCGETLSDVTYETHRFGKKNTIRCASLLNTSLSKQRSYCCLLVPQQRYEVCVHRAREAICAASKCVLIQSERCACVYVHVRGRQTFFFPDPQLPQTRARTHTHLAQEFSTSVNNVVLLTRETDWERNKAVSNPIWAERRPIWKVTK